MKEVFEMCKVSVIIPCYNCGSVIFDAIHSVKEQTFSGWEIVVVDDGSTDKETINILNQLENEKIRLIRQDNRGPAHARNMGISQARGEFILPLDADDTISPYYMAEAVPLFECNPNLGIVYCRAQKFGKETGEWNLPEYSSQRMAFDNVIFVSAFFRKSDWDLVGGFPAYTRLGVEDYAFWLRILRLGREVYRINKILFNYRIQNTSRSTIFNSDKEKMVETYAAIFRDNFDFFKNNIEGLYWGIFEYRERLEELDKYDIRNIIKKIPIVRVVAKKIWAFIKK
ncbi:glycosyltransferase [uncultured Desulfovibrio sp.]|uniref:glycosyltransferase n=1 Tax=uncultured Desulfovibrio sp. TaxID=167968 RepID=UPI0026125DCA|nr:glycosyltransferase [uncultured Desulfovibrio sp.]